MHKENTLNDYILTEIRQGVSNYAHFFSQNAALHLTARINST